jgi:DNA-binding protein Fis
MSRFPQLIVTEEQVLRALQDAQGNQRKAAQTLGVTQGWVTKWLKRNGFVQQVSWVKNEQIN